MTATSTHTRSAREDPMGLTVLAHAYCPPTLEALRRARATDAELVTMVRARLALFDCTEALWHLDALSPSELELLASLERAAS